MKNPILKFLIWSRFEHHFDIFSTYFYNTKVVQTLYPTSYKLWFYFFYSRYFEFTFLCPYQKLWTIFKLDFGRTTFFVYFTLLIPTWSLKDELDAPNHQVFILLGNYKITCGMNSWYGMNLRKTMSLVHTLIWQLINWHLESKFLPWSTPNCLISIQPNDEQ